VVDDQHRRVLGILELGEAQHRLLLNRPADVDELLVLDERDEVRHGLRDRRVRAAVQHQPRGALLVVLGDEDDGPPEVRVEQRRRGKKKLPLQRFHAHILSSPARFATSPPGLDVVERVGPARGG
jgi:hypothetical protein